MATTTANRTFTYETIDTSELGSLDLRIELADNPYAWAGAYRIRIVGSAETAEALVAPYADDGSTGRIGIAWGGPATWGDVAHIWATDTAPGEDRPEHVCDGVHGITEAIEDWLNDGDAWEARS